MGPMRAARRFVEHLRPDSVAQVRVELYGSLGATGAGHGTPGAVVLGLEGSDPETVDPDAAHARIATVAAERRLQLAGVRPIDFDMATDIVLSLRAMEFHSNGMVFTALDGDGEVLALSLIHISEPTRQCCTSRMPSSA